jgi:hypothetical protein
MEGELCEKQRLETKIDASSGLGNPEPKPSLSSETKHLAASTARSSGGSPRASDAFTAAITRRSKSAATDETAEFA